MSKRATQIIDSLRQLALPPIAICDGIAGQIDETTYTCTVTMADGHVLYGVQLKALKQITEGIVAIPAEGAIVQVLKLGEAGWIVIAATELQKVLLKIGDTTCEITADGWRINGGNQNGLVLLQPLVQQLNTLVQDLNTIKQAFAGWTPVPQDGGAALKAATTQWAAQTLQTVQSSNLENTHIQQ